MLAELDSSNMGLLLFFGTVICTIALLLLCACFRSKEGKLALKDNQNGHVYGSKIFTSSNNPELDDEDLRGARATSHRRLPEIPDPLAGPDNQIICLNSVRSSQDTTSELYAQVEIGAVASAFPVASNLVEKSAESKNPTVYNPVVAEVIDSHPYDKVKSNHGYSKLKKKTENPYAKVKRSDTMESEPAEADENETDTDNYDVVYTLRTVDETKKSDSAINNFPNGPPDKDSLTPPPLPLSTRGSHSSLVTVDSSHQPRPPRRGRRSLVLSHASSNGNIDRPISMLVDEQDSSANDADVVDERGAAVEAGPSHIHFSGDSQASQDSKGYSSISVREPLANLKAQGATNPVRLRLRERNADSVDPHYATVSDAEDSDEMYAAIAELPPLYDKGAGSDTYAKINDRLVSVPVPSSSPSAPTSPVAKVASPNVALDGDHQLSPFPFPPTPPSVVSLKQLSVGSSRLNASTLSIASQTSMLGSPKPEKRQANSPLPPPPFHAADGADASGNRKSMNIEEMYAKVMKKKGLPLAWQISSNEPGFKTTLHHRGSVDLGFLTVSRDDADFQYHDTSRRNSVDITPQRSDFNEGAQALEANIEEVAEVVAAVAEEEDDFDQRYEMVPTSRAARKTSESDHGYEKIQLKSEDSFNDPRYERIQLKRGVAVEPNYEIVGYKCNEILESDEPGYEEVQLRQRFNRGDPNYESLNYSVHSERDPPYAKVEDSDQSTTINNNIDVAPLYAQVTKPKTKTSTGDLIDAVHSEALEKNEQDLSVSSSRNTTIIRITDSTPAFHYFPDDESLGIPEQV